MERVTTRGKNYRTKPKDTKKTIKRVLKYLYHDKAKFIFVLIAAVINVLLSLTGTFLVSVIIDNVVKPIIAGTMEPIVLLYVFLGMIGCYIFGFIVSLFQQLVMVRLAQHALVDLRRDLMNKLLELPLSFYDKYTHGDIMSRFTNDIEMINEMFSVSALEIVTSLLLIVGVTIYVFILNWVMALVSFVFIPLMILVINYFTKKSRREFHETQMSLGELEGYCEEILAGQRIVKCFNKENDCINTFEEINSDLTRHSFKSNFNSSLTIPIVNNLLTIDYILCCLIGALLVFFNVSLVGATVTAGIMASFIGFVRQYQRPFNRITQQIASVQAALAGADRIFSIIDKDSETVHDKNIYSLEIDKKGDAYWIGEGNKIPVKGDIRLYNVDFSYVKNQPILQDLSLYAKPGQKIAFVGATGAGKTTITNLLTRFYDIEAGQITIDGIDLILIDRKSMRRSMTLVLQETHLFTGTIMDNIRFGNLYASDKDCIEAAKIAHADSFIEKLPKGYQTIVYGTNDTLSQGQRQLLSIARCAVNNPPILILDEATSSVDTRTEKLISLGMDELMKNKTTFVIAHRLSTVKNANAIMVLDHGKIIERGDHDDLMNAKGRYYTLCVGGRK